MKYYVSLGFVKWEEASASGVPLKASEKSNAGCGFLPVFASREEALKHFPDKRVLEIQDAESPPLRGPGEGK